MGTYKVNHSVKMISYKFEEKVHLLVDATNLLTRSFYAGEKNDDKTWGIFIFINAMLTIIKQQNPSTIHFCFDSPESNSWRKSIYPAYKANRKEKPEYLQYQLDLARKTMKRLGLSIYTHALSEADDIVATLCWKIEGNKAILSSDKDLIQLVDCNTKFFRYTKQFKNYETITPESFEVKYGFESRYFVDYQTLVGDVGDNIPGAKGIGPVAATKLVQEYKTVSNMMACEVDNELAKFRESRTNVKLSYELIKLRKIVDLEVQSGKYNLNMFHKMADIVKGENR